MTFAQAKYDVMSAIERSYLRNKTIELFYQDKYAAILDRMADYIDDQREYINYEGRHNNKDWSIKLVEP